ncbi:tripartite tricarboxylate transporter TctB family protein [Kerstersia gyiorum]|uniref:tripartite tricarboxylate transporter TctB family protein n=1 Tax=Kerstersia gyiorum TaxID=206506 RepID=UPI00209DB746|nr:tripartite tricarboxylate transporter TctB family protein [Kerstersia gyiorum]MCP1631722.1 hypothetical protein [Kerstersia gyiorum]MCP1636750.1 hypothetical protein [Kerstersia gyiorum]MCP1671477.1 hypothetical protein [Kerstersia gyiorum]MCP1677439.1 hypothetical protein [Kerstersia gyiorum]MCP1681557.1 hypothetical protein [Kerstersia gyiorum]
MQTEHTPVAGDGEAGDRPWVTRRQAECVTGLAAAIFGLLVMFGALENEIGWSDFGPAAGAFPFYVGVVILLAALWMTWQGWRRPGGADEVWLMRSQCRRMLSFFLPIVAYIVLSLWLGLYVGSALYLGTVMWRQGGYGPLRSYAVGVGVALAFFVVFEIGFQMALLKGPLENWLGVY